MKKKLPIIAHTFSVIGGVTWGLIGLFDINIIDYVFGQMWIEDLLYVIIGISAAYQFFTWRKYVR